jgi:hypothetical protein
MNIKDQKQREAAKMRVLRPLLDLIRRHKQGNVGIRIKLNQDNIIYEIRNYQQNRPRHTKRMENKHLSETALRYQSHGKRELGRPRLKCSEQDRLKVNELRRTGPTAIKLQSS